MTKFYTSSLEVVENSSPELEGIAQPLEFYRKFLEQDTRPDGRELTEFRTTVLNVGSISTADGSAFVTLGNTKVVCGIKAEVTAVKPEQNCEYIIPNVELPPLCGPQFKPGPPSEQAQTASHFIQQFILSSQCVKSSDLCIANGSMSWVLFCDFICLDYDGNLLDGCAIALVAALQNVRLPFVSVNEETGVVEMDFNHKVPLKIHSHPVATTFVTFNDKIVFADPTKEEELLSSGSFTIVVLENGDVSMVYKPGGACISDTKLGDCMVHCRHRATQVLSLIETSFKSLEH